MMATIAPFVSEDGHMGFVDRLSRHFSGCGSKASALRATGLMRYPAATMKLLSITQCARPVLFENASSDYPYSLSGTAVIETPK
jgi:hypothetical protein